MACAELDWLRKATLRHHGRLAARLAQALDLDVRFIEDVNAVDNVCTLLPSTSCVCRDLAMVNGRVLVTSDAALMDTCKSGLLFDCYASEGFWVFMGPRDTGSYRMFGNEFQVTGKYQGFPTKTVRYNKLFPPREKTNLVTPYGRQTVGTCDTDVQQAVLHKSTAEDNVLYSNHSKNLTCFMFPHAGFVNVLSQLGFNQNDGIINLMPITAYCDDE
jgi:hypothetical protein